MRGSCFLNRRWWESNPRALADLSHFECDLLRPLEYISRDCVRTHAPDGQLSGQQIHYIGKFAFGQERFTGGYGFPETQ